VTADRFGQESLGSPVILPDFILPTAKVPRVDLPAMGGLTLAALAANRSMIQLFNPGGSNTDLLLKRIWGFTGAANALVLFTHDTALASLSTKSGALVRSEGTNQIAPVGQIRNAQASAVGTDIGSWTTLANTLVKLEFMTGDGDHFDGIVIQPGRGILIAPTDDNIEVRATFQWLERQTA